MDALHRLRLTPGVGFMDILEGTTNGFFEVLVSFAKGMGYSVDFSHKGYGVATIVYNEQRISLQDGFPDLYNAYLLTHELAHEYTADIYGKVGYRFEKPAKVVQNEQVTEAVTYMILDEYGFDISPVAAGYIDGTIEAINRVRGSKLTKNWFQTGKLDNNVQQCYHAFSRDLKHFLTDGGTDVHGNA